MTTYTIKIEVRLDDDGYTTPTFEPAQEHYDEN
jgi:hypothetical protein